MDVLTTGNLSYKFGKGSLDWAIDTLQDLLQVSKPDLADEPYIKMNLCSEMESLLYLFQEQTYLVQVVKKFRDTDATIVDYLFQAGQNILELVQIITEE